MTFWHRCKKLGEKKFEREEIASFIFEFQTCSVKLGGALDGIAEGHGPRDAAFTVAYLKRALDHLHKSQAGLESVAKKKLLPEPFIAEARAELFAVREGILGLMQKLRES